MRRDHKVQSVNAGFLSFIFGIGLSLDLAEFALGTILATYFTASGTAEEQKILPWLLSSAYVGAIIGAGISGVLADAYGRRKLFGIITFGIFITSIAATLAPNSHILTFVRFCSGLFLGAYPPLVSTYLTETVPVHVRGKAVLNVVAIGSCGPVIVILIVHLLSGSDPLGIIAWRWGFAICAITALSCFFVFARLPESTKWLAVAKTTRRHPGAARKTPPVPCPLPATGSFRGFPIRIMLFLIVTFFTMTWSTVGFPLLIGSMLIVKGINLQQSLLLTGIASIGAVVGAFATATIIDRLDRKTALLLGAAAMAVMTVMFGWFSNPLWLVASAVVFNILAAMFWPILTIYAGEIVSTSFRARAASWSWAARGAGASLIPFIFLPFLREFGAVNMTLLIGLTIITFCILVVVYGPRGKAGAEVE